MKQAKVKLIQEKPTIRINHEWLPYRDIVNKKEYRMICTLIEDAISSYGAKNVKGYYEVLEYDEQKNLGRFTL